jgi:hypothetical protein
MGDDSARVENRFGFSNSKVKLWAKGYLLVRGTILTRIVDGKANISIKIDTRCLDLVIDSLISRSS